MSIFVGNLPFEVTEEDLSEAFSEYGKVIRIYFPLDKETKRKRGFAFVEMETPEQEDTAISTLDEAEWMGRQLKVNKARERENSSRSSGGGRGQNRNRH
ncbi:MAG: RNA-binding protein [Snowella sp.]|jgi:RNA recognition motif-containing protein|nr:RNA-binding protein [Snowella sp.]PZV28083.1 MAG: RNA-binding protein [Snowella sp.]